MRAGKLPGTLRWPPLQHASKALLEKGRFQLMPYLEFKRRCLASRSTLGASCLCSAQRVVHLPVGSSSNQALGIDLAPLQHASKALLGRGDFSSCPTWSSSAAAWPHAPRLVRPLPACWTSRLLVCGANTDHTHSSNLEGSVCGLRMQHHTASVRCPAPLVSMSMPARRYSSQPESRDD